MPDHPVRQPDTHALTPPADIHAPLPPADIHASTQWADTHAPTHAFGGPGPLAGILAIAVGAQLAALALAVASGAGLLAGLGLAWAGGTAGMAAGTALACRRPIARRLARLCRTAVALIQTALGRQPALAQPALGRRPAVKQPAVVQPRAGRDIGLDALLREEPRCPPML